MKHGRIVIYLLIISYIITLGHNFIPHHHHLEDQGNYIHFGLHHSSSEEDDNSKHEHNDDGFLCIFSNILHHDDNGLFVHSISDSVYKNVSLGNAFGLLSESAVFENYTIKNKREHPPENRNYLRLQQKYSHGLRAPPAA
jgi:hypothetical protein